MKRSLKLTFTILIGICALLASATGYTRAHSSPAQASFIPCPTHLIAPYGGTDGWSTIQVQANFARALVTPTRMMTCQYRFGTGRPFFGIQKPCPAGSRCIAVRRGFRVIP